MGNEKKTKPDGAVASKIRPQGRPSGGRSRGILSFALILASLAGMSAGCSGMTDEQWQYFQRGWRIGEDLANRFSDASAADEKVHVDGEAPDGTEETEETELVWL